MNDFLQFVGALNLGTTIFQQIKSLIREFINRFSVKEEAFYASIIDEMASIDIHNPNCKKDCRHKKENTEEERKKSASFVHSDIAKILTDKKLETEESIDFLERLATILAVFFAIIITFILYLDCDIPACCRLFSWLFLFPTFIMIVIIPCVGVAYSYSMKKETEKYIKRSYCHYVFEKAKKRAEEKQDTEIIQFSKDISDSQH